MVEDKSRLWGNQHPYFETATVTVTRVSDGGNLIISNRYSDTTGRRVPNVLSWQVEGWKYETLYEVEIAGVAIWEDYTFAILTLYTNLFGRRLIVIVWSTGEALSIHLLVPLRA